MIQREREERAEVAFRGGLGRLVAGLDEIYDAAFGLPNWYVEELQRKLQRFGLTVATRLSGEESKG